MTYFADRLIEGVRDLGPLCVGIDPHPGRIPGHFGGDTPDGIARWGCAVVEAATGRAAVVKPQVGLFERHGPAGLAALREVCRAGTDAGLLVIVDAKRGDIGSTAEGYAAAYLAADAPFPCDAVTVNPYMGLDTLAPFLRVAEANGRGVAVLARTSNPGAADFQDIEVEGVPVYARVAGELARLGKGLTGRYGWSGLMLVVGATAPAEAEAIRTLAQNNLFLVPGYGTQGGAAEAALASFVNGPRGLEGGIVNASRAVTFPDAAQVARDRAGWFQAVAEAIDAAQADLKTVVDAT